MAKKKCSLLAVVAKASWLITALAAINVGLLPFGYDFFQSQFFMMNLVAMGAGIHYLIGLCGLFSLATFAIHCSGGCKDKNCKM